jgi:hypothetical protein
MLPDEPPAARRGAWYEPLRSWNAHTSAPSPQSAGSAYERRTSTGTLAMGSPASSSRNGNAASRRHTMCRSRDTGASVHNNRAMAGRQGPRRDSTYRESALPGRGRPRRQWQRVTRQSGRGRRQAVVPAEWETQTIAVMVWRGRMAVRRFKSEGSLRRTRCHPASGLNRIIV